MIIIKREGIKFNARLYSHIREASKKYPDGFSFVLHRKNQIGIPSEHLIIKKENKDVDQFIRDLINAKVNENDTLVIQLMSLNSGIKKYSNIGPVVLFHSKYMESNPIMSSMSDYNSRATAIFHSGGRLLNFKDPDDINSDSYNFITSFLNKNHGTKNNKTTIDIMFGLKKAIKNTNTFRATIHGYPLFRDNKIVVVDPEKGLMITGQEWEQDSHGHIFSEKCEVKTHVKLEWGGW